MPYFHLLDYGFYMIGWIQIGEEKTCLSHEFFEGKEFAKFFLTETEKNPKLNIEESFRRFNNTGH